MTARPRSPGQPFSVELNHSRPALLAIDEPQVLYTLVTIRPGKESERPQAPALNLCIALDRSTSMAGERLDTARSSVSEILRRLRAQDHLSLLTFSDRAEVLVSARSQDPPAAVEGRLNQVQTSGGTEIFQGLQAAMTEIREGRRTGAIDHIILVTDGQTYGDEENCRQLAEQAAQEGTEITAVGIGAGWNDVFLDSLAARTGGQAVFIDQVATLAQFMREKFHGFGQVYADHLTLDIATNPGVILRSAYRLSPSPTPLPTQTFLRLGTLYQGSSLSLLLEFLFSPLSTSASFEVGSLAFEARLVPDNQELQSMLGLAFPVLEEVVPAPISGPLLAAVRSVTLYQLQEKAVAEASAGHVERATRKLNRLASALLELGQNSVANTVIGEAEQLSLEHRLSESGPKRLKYETRSLMEARGGAPR